MAVNLADDELFTRAISGYREAFLVQHSHLSESERNQLWSQRLSQFLPANNDDEGTTGGKSGKRTRQDAATPRTLPSSGSGLPHAKRRATVRVTLVSCSRLLSSPSLRLSPPPRAKPGLTIGRPRIFQSPPMPRRRPPSTKHRGPTGTRPWSARRASRSRSLTGVPRPVRSWANGSLSGRQRPRGALTMSTSTRRPSMQSTIWMTPSASLHARR